MLFSRRCLSALEKGRVNEGKDIYVCTRYGLFLIVRLMVPFCAVVCGASCGYVVGDGLDFAVGCC
jgi:hypothetical protein